MHEVVVSSAQLLIYISTTQSHSLTIQDHDLFVKESVRLYLVLPHCPPGLHFYHSALLLLLPSLLLLCDQ